MSISSDEKHNLNAEQFRLLVDNVVDYSIYLLSPEGLITSWNSGAKKIKGYQADEVVGQHFSIFFTDEDRAMFVPDRALATAREVGRFETEGLRIRKDGSRFWAHVIMDVIKDDDDKFVGFAKIVRDISRQKEDAERLKEANRVLNLALGAMARGLFLFGSDGRLLLANPRVSEIFGLKQDGIRLGQSFPELIKVLFAGPDHTDDVGACEAAVRIAERHQALIDLGDEHAVLEETNARKIVSIFHRRLPEGGWLTTFEDVTERQNAANQLAHMARHDEMTGLPNRQHFLSYLQEELERAERGDQKVGVIAIDLDRFKEINDLHGYAAGDMVLTVFSARMKALLQGEELVARLDGDEFAAVIRFNDTSNVNDFVARLESCFAAPVRIEALEQKVGASLGIAVFPQDGSSAGQLLKNADLAMYRAKNALGRSVCFYEARMDEIVRINRAMASDLWKALERQEFALAYQVQKSIETNEMIGCEALLRWQHPRRGWISPNEFIPIAEECGAIVKIGEWVLRQACRDAASWPGQCRVAVNVSPRQLQHNFPSVVSEALLESGLDAERLEIEITESTIISDKANALLTLQRLQTLGVTVALDDFGTGYSSLDTLKSFHFDKIKLDKVFLEEVTQSAQAKAVIRAIIALGRSLSVPVLAEGVETEEQLDLLRAEGCDEAQGFLLGRPQIGRGCELT